MENIRKKCILLTAIEKTQDKQLWVCNFEPPSPSKCNALLIQNKHTKLFHWSNLEQDISEPIFYGDLVYKFKRIVGKPNFSDQLKKIVKRYISVGYNLHAWF